jgi:hypothetical protein
MDPIIIYKIGTKLNMKNIELDQFNMSTNRKSFLVTEPEHSRRCPTFYRNYLITLTHRDTGKSDKS